MIKKLTRSLNWLMIAVGSVFLLSMLWGVDSAALLGDETFSMKLSENSFPQIVRLTAMDVHPPLYYFILRIIVILGKMISVNPVVAGKFASVLPFLLLEFVSLTRVRKRFGDFAAAFSFMSIAGMPQMMNYAVNIRMYSWGMFFLAMSFLAFCDLIVCVEEKQRIAAVEFVLWGIAAVYTHYFACIGIAFLYLILLGYWYRRQKKSIKIWFLCAAMLCVAYLPWIPTLLNQIGSVREEYWIEPIKASSVVAFFKFLFNPSVWAYHSGTILGAFLCLLVLMVLLKHDKTADGRIYVCSAAGIGMVFFVMLIGCLVSLLMKPVLVQRYLFLATGAMWLGVAIGLSGWKNELVRIGSVLFALTIGVLNLQAFVRVENESRDGYRELLGILEQVEDEDVILSNFGQVRLALSYMAKETTVCYYWHQQTDKLFVNLYGNLVDTRDTEEILTYLTMGNKMYYFDALEVNEFHFQKDCEDKNVTFQNKGKCLIEDVWVQVYEIRRRSM